MVSGVDALQVVGDVLVIVGALDLVLAGVSIVPAFPLDGGRLVRAIGWARSGDPRRGALLGARRSDASSAGCCWPQAWA